MFTFDSLESVSDESNAAGYDQKFVRFLNMGLEIVCQFLFKSREGIFEKPKKLVWTAKKRLLLTPISPFLKMLKIFGLDSFVERTIFCKI